MEALPTVLLKPGEADRVLGGHPWIYAGSIMRMTGSALDGAMVQVKDHRQRFLGSGFYNSKSKIQVRMLSRERVDPDLSFFQERLASALELRKRHLPGTTSFRVVNAESDFLSGLIVDKYEDVLVLQTSSLGMDQRKELIVEALTNLLKPRAVVERNDISSRKFEGLEPRTGILSGNLPADSMVTAHLNGLGFETPISSGHKTGLYLDQQLNYLAVGKLARGGEVLDCFSFHGGFALHAAREGASHVHAVDQSEEALAVATKNAEGNGLTAKCSFEAANVFDWLKQKTAVGPHEKVIPRYDLIILDPPSFTRTRDAVADAMRGYKEIHLRALKLLKKSGTLATFCCSHHVSATMFMEVILEAAFDAHRTLRRTAIYTQSPDHPVLPAIPETEYLKGFAFEII